jgi:hypothetical protein
MVPSPPFGNVKFRLRTWFNNGNELLVFLASWRLCVLALKICKPRALTQRRGDAKAQGKSAWANRIFNPNPFNRTLIKSDASHTLINQGHKEFDFICVYQRSSASQHAFKRLFFS